MDKNSGYRYIYCTPDNFKMWILRKNSFEQAGKHFGLRASYWFHVHAREHHGVSYHRPFDCLSNRLFTLTSQKAAKLRITGTLGVKSTGTRWIPSQRASEASPCLGVIMNIMWHQKQAEAISSVGMVLKVFDLCRKGLRSLQSNGTNGYLGNCSLTKWHIYIYIWRLAKSLG